MIEIRRYLQGHVADGRFPLIHFLGATEHSCVFLTEHAEAENNRAAIKLIPAPPRSTEPMLTRWRLAARFSHPNLLRLYEAGRCRLDGSDMLYVVTEFAEENLGETLIHRPLSPAETHEMLCPILDALGYLHGKGFVHGHVQPSNIMAIGDRLKLSSDRIAHVGQFADRQNGNARYCAPECGSECLSPAGDIWSLGMTIVECLTDHLPEVDTNRGTASVPTDLPAPFLELARHCLAKAPHRRWDVAALKSRLKLNSFALKEETAVTVRAPVAAPARVAEPETEGTAEPTAEHKTEAAAESRIEALAAAASVVLNEIPAKLRGPVALAVAGIALATIVLGVAFHKHGSHASANHAIAAERPAAQNNAVRSSANEHVASARAALPTTSPSPMLAVAGRSSAVADAVEASAAPPAALRAMPVSEPVRGRVVHRALPHVPDYASRTISGTVRVGVRVKVDPAGRVAAAELDSAGPSRYFARLSVEAARGWEFASARNLPSEWLIRFDYTSSATTATAVPQIR